MRPRLLVPLHLTNADPSFFVVAGIIFTVLSEPYLLSEYGVDYMSEAPVKLLERLMHGERAEADEQVFPLLFANFEEGHLDQQTVWRCLTLSKFARGRRPLAKHNYVYPLVHVHMCRTLPISCVRSSDGLSCSSSCSWEQPVAGVASKQHLLKMHPSSMFCTP